MTLALHLGAGRPAAGWWHPKAVLSLDFFNDRHAKAGARLPHGRVLSTVRSSTALLTDADGVVRSFPANALASLPGVGAYIGAQATNLYQNPRMIGAQVGQPLPTGAPARWQPTGSPAGITSTVVDVGTRQGLPYFAVRFHGTASASGNQSIRPEAYNSIPMAVGQTVAQAISVRRVAGVVPALILGIVGSNDSNIFVQSFGNVTATLTSDITRFFGSGVATAGVTRGYGQLSVPFVEGQTYDFTIEIYPPLLIVGGVTFDPGYVLPGEGMQGVSTRLASDVRAASMDWFSAAGLDAGFAVLAEVALTHVGDGVPRTIFEISDGLGSNRVQGYINASSQFQMLFTVAGATTYVGPAIPATTGRRKIAFRVSRGLTRVVASGAAPSTNATENSVPVSLNRLDIGGAWHGGARLNDTLRSMQVCRPLTDAEMDAWVAA